MTPSQILDSQSGRDKVKDILLKAASDVEQGLWCRGSWFREKDDENSSYADNEVFDILEEYKFQIEDPKLVRLKTKTFIDSLQELQRCAEGSIALSAVIAGLSEDYYKAAVKAVDIHFNNPKNWSRYHEVGHLEMISGGHNLSSHNDQCLQYMVEDNFEAGAHLAEMFRNTVEEDL